MKISFFRAGFGDISGSVGVFTLVAAIMLALLVGGCKRGEEKPIANSVKSDAEVKNPSSAPVAADVNLETPTVRIETTAGIILIRLDGVHAPGTVRNFLNLANDKFYDNTLIHFVDPGQMIVAGGYGADRQPKPTGFQIRSEADNGLKNKRGTIAMTRDPARIDSATSQFFINLVDAPQRDHTGDSAEHNGYCVFGEVTEGLEVAAKISQAPTANQGGDLAQTPEPPIVIKAVRVVK